MKTFKTPKGTELPIMDIKGKDYLQAAPRIFWMKEEHPDWSIDTEFLQLTPEAAVCKATIRDGQGKLLATATSMETPKGFESYVEKSETCAVSRAASFCGYGTLLAQELEEQGKLAESPQDPKSKSHLQQGDDTGAYVIKISQNLKGKRLDACDMYELAQFSKWLTNQPKLEGIGLETRDRIEAFLATRTPKKGKQ